jgi:hypothetical protein
MMIKYYQDTAPMVLYSLEYQQYLTNAVGVAY